MHNLFLIVIVNYNGSRDTIECIESLKSAGVDDSNLLLIDNHSTDDSFQQFSGRYPNIKMIENNVNMGFAGANNIGIKYGLQQGFKYIILLNNDTIVEKDSIKILIEEMDKNPGVSLGTGQIRYFFNKAMIWYGGGKIVPWRGLAVHINMNKYFKDIPYSNKLIPTEFISGCYLCLRSKHISELGYLNENFFMYLEDIEFSVRANKKKMKLAYIPKSIIYHKWRGDTKLKYHSLYYAVRNRKLLIDLVFPKCAKYYFSMVIYMKLSFWFLINRELFQAAKKGLKDYNQKYFGQISTNTTL